MTYKLNKPKRWLPVKIKSCSKNSTPTCNKSRTTKLQPYTKQNNHTGKQHCACQSNTTKPLRQAALCTAPAPRTIRSSQTQAMRKIDTAAGALPLLLLSISFVIKCSEKHIPFFCFKQLIILRLNCLFGLTIITALYLSGLNIV